jgi:hypothetical protein
MQNSLYGPPGRIFGDNPLDGKEYKEPTLDFVLHLSRFFGLGDFGFLCCDDCRFVTESSTMLF